MWIRIKRESNENMVGDREEAEGFGGITVRVCKKY